MEMRLKVMQTATPTILQKIGYSYKDEEENEVTLNYFSNDSLTLTVF